MTTGSLQTLWGGVEAGGSKFICSIGTITGEILKQTQIPTRNPDETLADVITFFEKEHANQVLACVGVGCFGPLDLDPASTTYGHITNTPKTNWANIDILGRLRQAIDVPIAIDTDVNAAALGEHKWGAARGIDNFIYLTVGTGIGGGAMINGQLVHGLVHPEMGHILLPHDLKRDPFRGACYFHGDCLEGMASGPAMKARWGKDPESLEVDHEAWDLEAEYLSYALSTLILAYSPQRIILGGGVLSQPQLLPKIWSRVPDLLNGYVHSTMIKNHISDYIVRPKLGPRSGVLGAIALAQASMSPSN
jgi:fructokinase